MARRAKFKVGQVVARKNPLLYDRITNVTTLGAVEYWLSHGSCWLYQRQIRALTRREKAGK